MIMLIQHAEKKEKSYSKRYDEMSSQLGRYLAKWSFGDDAILVTD